jgi:hypothetical protein
MKKLDLIEIALGGLFFLGITMAAVSFFSARGPDSVVVDSEIHEITPAPPAHSGFGKPSQQI